MRRFYPRGELTSHVVGSTGMVDDDVVEHGNAGIEAEFDEELAGSPGLALDDIDVSQDAYDSVITRKPEPGEDITLSLDSNLQYVAERELDKAIDSSGAKTGSIVALNPYTGDVLVMVNYPHFDPNAPPSPAEPPNARSNLAITTPFEPGSVFKVITLTAAIESLKYKPETMIPCGSVLQCLRPHHQGRASARALQHGRRSGAFQQCGRGDDRAEGGRYSNLYKYQRKFGFGQKTGIDLPGESAGLLKRGGGLVGDHRGFHFVRS